VKAKKGIGSELRKKKQRAASDELDINSLRRKRSSLRISGTFLRDAAKSFSDARASFHGASPKHKTGGLHREYNGIMGSEYIENPVGELTIS
jgi:hypothetical protein